jgi:hypothetical protein
VNFPSSCGDKMDPRVAASHSSFAGCSTCFQQSSLRSVPRARGLIQVQCVKVKAPKDAEFKKESRIGKAPIKIPSGVTVKFDSDLLEVKVGLGTQEPFSLVLCRLIPCLCSGHLPVFFNSFRNMQYG